MGGCRHFTTEPHQRVVDVLKRSSVVLMQRVGCEEIKISTKRNKEKKDECTSHAHIFNKI